jgi:ribosomal protein L7Ae-like RNA K-turn-binding protein
VRLLEFYNFLGIAMRAGACIYGSEPCEKGIKSGRVKLLILDAEVSENTKKHFRDMCAYRNVEIIELKDKERLGRSIGKEHIKIVGITDSGFCDNILVRFKEGSEVYPSN